MGQNQQKAFIQWEKDSRKEIKQDCIKGGCLKCISWTECLAALELITTALKVGKVESQDPIG